MYTRLMDADQISHTQSMVAKRVLTKRENVHTPMWKTQHGRVSSDTAILAAIGRRFTAKKINKNVKKPTRARRCERRPETCETLLEA